MISASRLGDPGERGSRLRIVVDGRPADAHAGETIAAVLLVGGVGVFRRTSRLGSPRALFCGMGACFDCLVTVDGRPNVRACITPVAEGMRVDTGGSLG